MTPDQEQALFQKVDRIHTAIVGFEGQPHTGLLATVNNHERRLGRLENWRYYVLGGIAVIVFVIEVAARVVR